MKKVLWISLVIVILIAAIVIVPWLPRMTLMAKVGVDQHTHHVQFAPVTAQTDPDGSLRYIAHVKRSSQFVVSDTTWYPPLHYNSGDVLALLSALSHMQVLEVRLCGRRFGPFSWFPYACTRASGVTVHNGFIAIPDTQ